MDNEELKKLALAGIEAEITRLQQLRVSLIGTRRATATAPVLLMEQSDGARPRRKRTMSPAQRKAVSLRMKKRWAEVRKAAKP